MGETPASSRGLGGRGGLGRCRRFRGRALRTGIVHAAWSLAESQEALAIQRADELGKQQVRVRPSRTKATCFGPTCCFKGRICAESSFCGVPISPDRTMTTAGPTGNCGSYTTNDRGDPALGSGAQASPGYRWMASGWRSSGRGESRFMIRPRGQSMRRSQRLSPIRPAYF